MGGWDAIAFCAAVYGVEDAQMKNFKLIVKTLGIFAIVVAGIGAYVGMLKLGMYLFGPMVYPISAVIALSLSVLMTIYGVLVTRENCNNLSGKTNDKPNDGDDL